MIIITKKEAKENEKFNITSCVKVDLRKECEVKLYTNRDFYRKHMLYNSVIVVKTF